RVKHFKALLFRLLGKEEEAVAGTFGTGSDEQVGAILEEARRIMPDRRHVLVSTRALGPFEGGRQGVLAPGSAPSLWMQLIAAFRKFRIGMAPVLFDGNPEHSPLRLAAFLRAPGKILAYNRRLERHHLQFRTAIASWLFWRGVPLDRIWLRPR